MEYFRDKIIIYEIFVYQNIYLSNCVVVEYPFYKNILW